MKCEICGKEYEKSGFGKHIYQSHNMHADPRFFNENDINEITKQTAKEIWDADLNKIKLAEYVGIKLYRIKEYD